jgi:hypothetical protein
MSYRNGPRMTRIEQIITDQIRVSDESQEWTTDDAD